MASRISRQRTLTRSLSPLHELNVLLGEEPGFLGFVKRVQIYVRLDRSIRNNLKIAYNLLRHPNPAQTEIIKATSILRSIGFTDHAVEVLKSRQFYKEAADLLLTMNKTEDAARYYVKAKAWDAAYRTYYMMGDILKSAKCAVQLEQFDDAARLFEQAGEHVLAAKCHARCDRWRRAALLFGTYGRLDYAQNSYRQWMKREPRASTTQLDGSEIALLIALVVQDRVEPAMIPVLEYNGAMLNLVQELIKSNRVKLAGELLQPRLPLLGNDLYAWACADTVYAERTLTLCRAIEDFRGVATILEHLGRIEEAFVAWERAGDLDAAYNCAVKAELWDRVDDLKVRLAAAEVKAKEAEAADASYRSQAGITIQLEAPKQVAPGQFSLEAAVDAESTEVMAAPAVIDLAEVTGLKPLQDGQVAAFVAEAEVTAQRQVARSSDSKIEELPEFQNFEDDLRTAFSDSPFIANFSEDDREALFELGEVKHFAKGETIVELHDHTVGTMTILRGAIRVTRIDDSGQEVHQKTYGAGTNVGESWSMLNLRSGVKIVATADAQIHVIERERLGHYFLGAPPEVEALKGRLLDQVLQHLMVRVNPKAMVGEVLPMQFG